MMGFWLLLAAYTLPLLVITIATLHRSSSLSSSSSSSSSTQSSTNNRSSSPAPTTSPIKSPPPPPPLPPGPAGHPILGSLLYVLGPLRHNPHRSLVSLAESHGPIVYLRLGLTRAMAVVSSAAAAHEALVKNDAALAARLVPDNVRALSYGATSMVFLPSSDALWRRLRVLIGAGFSSSAHIRPVLERRAAMLADHLRSSSSAAGGSPVKVNIREVVNGTVLNVVSNVLFSEDVVDLDSLNEEKKKKKRTAFKSLVVPVLEEWSKPSVADAFPFLAPLEHLLGSRRRISTHLAKLFRFFDEEIIEKRLLLAAAVSGELEKEKHGDILDVLLEKMAVSKLTRQQITTFLTDMFIAASDTSTVTVQWAMAELLRHPEKMKKVNLELAEQLGPKNFITESDVNNLPYLHAVVKETLRLHPAVPLIPREVVADDVSLGGFHVPKGTGVIVNLWAIGRDKNVWPCAEEFIPERFLAGEEEGQYSAMVKEAFRPFGAGRRVCPGMDYTARSVPLLLATILHKNEWRLPDDSDGDGIGLEGSMDDLKDRYGTVLNPATPLHAVLVSTR